MGDGSGATLTLVGAPRDPSLERRWLVARKEQRGARRLEWEAEPNAQGFYDHMGGVYVRDSEETEWGRVLEVLGVEL